MIMTVIMMYESVILKHEYERDYKTDHEGLRETITSARILQNPLNAAARLFLCQTLRGRSGRHGSRFTQRQRWLSGHERV